MDEITVAIGISSAVITLYRLWVLYKRSTKISKNSLFLGAILIVLCIEAVDMLTINWLYNYLRYIYYNRLIGGLIDAMMIGVLFREPNEGLSHREIIIIAKLQVLSGAAIFSWLFMYLSIWKARPIAAKTSMLTDPVHVRRCRSSC